MTEADMPGTRLIVSFSRPLAHAGRALLGTLFLVSGLLKIGRFAGIAGALAAKGIPLPEAVVVVVILLEVAGGAALVIGWRTRGAAIGLALFTALATLLFHAFWSVDPAALSNQLNHFLKNVAIIGALLMIVASNGLETK